VEPQIKPTIMIDIDNYTNQQIKDEYLKSIQIMEDYLIDNKLGATTPNGEYNYDFLIMSNHTHKLLQTRKSLKEDQKNDITIGDIV
jgi:hypothetical protein